MKRWVATRRKQKRVIQRVYVLKEPDNGIEITLLCSSVLAIILTLAD